MTQVSRSSVFIHVKVDLQGVREDYTTFVLSIKSREGRIFVLFYGT